MLTIKENNDEKNEWNIEKILRTILPNEDFFVEGLLKKKLNGIASLAEANELDLAFCSSISEKALQQLSGSNAGIILCKKDLKGRIHPREGQQLIFLDHPRLIFVVLANRMRPEITSSNKSPLIAKTASIENDAKIGANCFIGNFVAIGKNCDIGDNTIIHDRVTLFQNCKIGKNCVIQSGVVLGEDGFSYERHENNELEKFPHKKGVIIGNNVEICANTNIARGSLNDTVIGNGTKIDAMVHIAHNTKIGKNCMITGGTVIGGSVVIGDSCWTGLNCTIKNKITIGNNVIVGAGACVIHNVNDGDVVAGVPAKSIKDKVSSDEVFLMSGKNG